MKIDKIYEELQELAKRAGIDIRRSAGRFKSGYAVLEDRKIIVFNRTAAMETKCAVISRCLLQNGIEGYYVKPAVREFIENEKENLKNNPDFKLKIDY